MTDTTVAGANWPDWQNDLIVAEYFEIDRIQRAGGTTNKAERYRNLGALINRSDTSVERKLQNVSAVLEGLKMDWATGLTPLRKFQQSLVNAVERYLDSNPLAVFGPPISELPDISELVEEPPPPKGEPGPPLDRKLERIARKFNYAERDSRNRTLGRAGEEFIYRREQKRLLQAGKPKLAEQVEWTADKHGDGVGYDIKSFEPSGAERLIEVKTTKGGRTTDFFLSRTEHEVSLERPDAWRLFRIHSFDKKPGLFVLTPPLAGAVNLRIESWRAQVG